MKINGDFGYVVKDAEGYHVHGSETEGTKENELAYRMDPEKLESVSMDFPVYASVYDFNTDETPNIYREAENYMSKAELLLEVKRLITIDETIPMCNENIYFLAKKVLVLVDWQNLSDFLWDGFANEDLPVYQKELPVPPAPVEEVHGIPEYSELLNALLKYQASHQKDLAYVTSKKESQIDNPFDSPNTEKKQPFFELYYDAIEDDVYVTYSNGKYCNEDYCEGSHCIKDVQSFEKDKASLDAILAIVVKNLKQLEKSEKYEIH